MIRVVVLLALGAFSLSGCALAVGAGAEQGHPPEKELGRGERAGGRPPRGAAGEGPARPTGRGRHLPGRTPVLLA